jgi:putative FmdB family regulatory protein
MPLYEYECARCGRRFELMQKFSDPPTTTCACGGTANRLLSPAGFQFKGSGWYVTDYARKAAPAEKTEGAPAAASKSDGAAASDTKTKKKSEPARIAGPTAAAHSRPHSGEPAAKPSE